jgi:hypothetical protein
MWPPSRQGFLWFWVRSFSFRPGMRTKQPSRWCAGLNLKGYGNLCAFITQLRRASEKGTYRLTLDDMAGSDLADCLALLVP